MMELILMDTEAFPQDFCSFPKNGMKWQEKEDVLLT